VLVTADGRVYDYRITRTLRVSFRDHDSRMSQSAPPWPSARTQPPTRGSSCRPVRRPRTTRRATTGPTALGNPEHRIDKVGRLVDVRPER